MDELISVEALEKLNKSDLQKQYETELKTAPEEKLTKAELIDAIVANREMEGIGTEPAPASKPATEAPAPVAEEKPAKAEMNSSASKDLKVVKRVDGKIVDESRINATVWNNLPPGKHGWELAAPAEISGE